MRQRGSDPVLREADHQKNTGSGVPARGVLLRAAMELKPITETIKPQSPRRARAETSLRRWLRRGLTALATSGALAISGCGMSTLHSDLDDPTLLAWLENVTEQPPLPEDPEPMDGGIGAPSFTCGSAAEYWVEPAPTYLEGGLCDDQPAMGTFDVYTAGTYRITVSWGGEFVLLDIIDPGGEVVAEIGPDDAFAELHLEEGRWTLSATPADPIDHPFEWFGVSIQHP